MSRVTERLPLHHRCRDKVYEQKPRQASPLSIPLNAIVSVKKPAWSYNRNQVVFGLVAEA
jgi:hypothetical protein